MKKGIIPHICKGFLKRYPLIGGIFSVLVILLSSCTEFEKLGLDLIDHRVGIVSTDTITLIAYTVAENPLPTSQNRNSLLGFYNDPLFGKTQASIYTETRMVTTGITIGGNISRDSIVLDSIVLILAYTGYHGDLTTLQNIKVYELYDTIPTSTVLSNHQVSTKGEVLNQQWNPSTLYRFAPYDSLYIGPDSIRVIPQLRLRLNDSFGRRFIDAPPSVFESVANYLQFFRGFKITAYETSGTGAIAYFALGSPASTLLVYFKVIGDSPTARSRVHEFPINEFARRFTQFENFEHAYASDIIRQQVIYGDTAQGSNTLFVQGMSNFKVRLHMPYLDDLFNNNSDKPAIINSARLILPVNSAKITDNFGIASALFLARKDAQGNLVNLYDFALGADYFGGVYDGANHQYVFNITQHIQAVSNGKIPNSPIYVLVSAASQSAQRAVLRGTASENPLRIEIKYSMPL